MSRDDARTHVRRRADDLVLRALDAVLSICVAPDAPLHLTIRETEISGPEGATLLIVAGMWLRLPSRPALNVYVPLLIRLWRRNGLDRPERPSRGELVRDLLGLIADRHPRRRLHAAAGEGYAERALGDLPANVTVTVNMPGNAIIHGPPPPRTGRPGRPRRRGDRLGSLSDLAAAGSFAGTPMGAAGTAVKRIEGQWYAVFAARPVQILLVRCPSSPGPFDIALASTDLDAGVAELLARYGSTRGGAIYRQLTKRVTAIARVSMSLVAGVARLCRSGTGSAAP